MFPRDLSYAQYTGSTTLRRKRADAEQQAWLASQKVSGGGNHRSSAQPDLLKIRERRIREGAYLRSERRGFAPGHEVEDWLDAEQEVDRNSRSLPRG
jgi:hypothetical protein